MTSITLSSTTVFTSTCSDFKYFVTFADKFSRFSHIAAISKKSDTKEAFQKYRQEPFVTKYFEKGIQRLHSESGGEYEKVTTGYG